MVDRISVPQKFLAVFNGKYGTAYECLNYLVATDKIPQEVTDKVHSLNVDRRQETFAIMEMIAGNYRAVWNPKGTDFSLEVV